MGRKTYVIEYRPGLGGRASPKRRYVIGKHGAPWTTDSARTEATRILGLVADGEDPAADKSIGRKTETVKELGELFIEQYAKVRQRRWKETDRVFRKNVFPVVGSRRVTEITRQEMARLIAGIEMRSPIMAARALAYVRKFFNWCIERGYIEINPCARIRISARFASRERVLNDEELALVWKAATNVGGQWEAIVKLLTLTAQRRTEVVEIRWSEIDFQKKVWTIPGTRTKNHRTHEVPLCETAIQILKDQKEIAGCPFVFSTTGRSAVSGLSKAKLEIDAEIAKLVTEASETNSAPEVKPLPHWVYHDLRRTATTGMARLGVHPHVADAVLNHKEGTIRGVAAVYNRHAYMPDRQRALELWEKHILAILETGFTEISNVVNLKTVKKTANA